MILAHSGTLRLECQGKFLGKRGNNRFTAMPAFLVKESEPGGDKKDHELEECSYGKETLSYAANHVQQTTLATPAANQRGACITILAHSATLHAKCQEKTKVKNSKKITGKIKEQETLLNNNFSPSDKSTPIPACFTVRGRATKQQQLPRNRGQEDHGPNNQLIYGAVPLLKCTIQTPKEAMIQREVHP